MKIGPVDSGDRPPKPDEQGERRHDIRHDEKPKNDIVEISDSARSLSEQPAAREIEESAPTDRQESQDEVSEVDSETDRVERARQRTESGYYDRPEVRREIARRIADDFME